MSDGFRCKHCGWQETEHKIGLPNEAMADDILRGYKSSLRDCSGFQLNKRDSAKLRGLKRSRLLSDYEMQMYESRANERAAWGAYAAHVRQVNFSEQLESFDKEESSAPSYEAQEDVRKRRNEFLKSAEISNGWVIG